MPAAKGAVSAPVGCPSCSAPLPERALACPTCGLALTGPAAAELWRVDQQIGGLLRRRSELLTQLHPSAPPPPGRPAVVPPLPVPRANWTGQQLLLGAGALLLATAAVVFLAVAWPVLGVAGQVAVMALVTGLCVTSAFVAARRGLRGTAETLAALSAVLAVVDAAAAYTLDLAGLGSVDQSGFAAVACVGLGLGAAVATFGRTRLYTWRLATVVFAAAAAPFALDAADPDAALAAGVLLLVSAAFALALRYLPTSWRSVRVPVTLASGSYLVASWSIAGAGLLSDPLVGTGGVCALIALAGAAPAAAVSRLPLGLRAARRHPVLAAAALLVTAATVVAVGWRADESGLVVLVLAVAAALAAGWLTVGDTPLATGASGVGAVLAHLVLVLALVVGQLASLDQVADHTPVWFALTCAYAVAAASLGVTAVRRAGLRPLAAGGSGVLAQLAFVAAAYPSGTTATVSAATAAGVLLAVAAGRRRARTEELVLLATAALALLTAVSYGYAESETLVSPLVAAVLAAAGLTALGYGLLPARGSVSVVGVLLFSASTWVLSLDRGVTLVEAYSLPLACLAAVVGLVRLYRDRTAPSWLTVGPALSAALLPSALATVGDDSLIRPLLVLTVAAAALVAGVGARWQAPVLTGSLALVVVAVSQLGPYAVGLPRWLTFGTVGLVLLVLGARYEQRRRNVRQAARWMAALH